MRIIDRYLLVSFVVAYLICFVSMVGLYVIIDLFTNVDEFLEDHPTTWVFVRKVGKYYGIHSFHYFDKLSPIITMIAAMTTLASLHRHNEIVALLSSGIPTMRALGPILVGVVLVIGLGVGNREFVLPAHSERLQRLHEDIEATHDLQPARRIDSDGVLFSAKTAHRDESRLGEVSITIPAGLVGPLQEIQCSNAFWRTDQETGELGWQLVRPTGVNFFRESRKIKPLRDGDLFLYSDITFSDMIRRDVWLSFASTTDLVRHLAGPDAKDAEGIRARIHSRLMQPALNLILVMLGIPFVLQWERRNVYRSIAISMVLCGMFFMVDVTAAYFAGHGYLDPVLAAWIPVFVFGPVSAGLLHRVGT
jgi:lipopolysaccharide export system permease protein